MERGITMFVKRRCSALPILVSARQEEGKEGRRNREQCELDSSGAGRGQLRRAAAMANAAGSWGFVPPGVAGTRERRHLLEMGEPTKAVGNLSVYTALWAA